MERRPAGGKVSATTDGESLFEIFAHPVAVHCIAGFTLSSVLLRKGPSPDPFAIFARARLFVDSAK
jgi:hypothetical protein